MSTTPTRRLAVGLALTLSLALGLAPTAAGAAGGYATPTVPPPPAGPGGFAIARPLLSVELDDATEADGLMEGRVVLSAPLAQALSVDVTILFPGADPSDLGCPNIGGGGACDWSIGIDLPAGSTEAGFDIGVHDGDGDEPAEAVGARITAVSPAGAVRLGPDAVALLYDGSGLELGFTESNPEALEGDPGSDGTLDLVVEANQAVPHPVTVRVHTVIVGFGAEPGLDYQPVDVIAELPAGQVTMTVEVPLVGDLIDEQPYEILMAHVSSPSHGKIALSGGTTVPRILDDDGPVRWTGPGGYQSPSRSARSAAFTA